MQGRAAIVQQHIPSVCVSYRLAEKEALHNGPPPTGTIHRITICPFIHSSSGSTTISKITFIRSSRRQRRLLRFLIIIISTHQQTDLNKQRPLITTARPVNEPPPQQQQQQLIPGIEYNLHYTLSAIKSDAICPSESFKNIS